MPINIEKVMRMNAEAQRREQEEAEAALRGNQIRDLPIDALEDFPPEKHRFRPATGQRLRDLEESIRQIGIVNALIVRELEPGRYQIITGHNRRTAARNIGYRSVPCLVRVFADDDEALGVLIADNLQNRDLQPSERGWAYRDLMDMRKRRAGRPSNFGKSDINFPGVNTRIEIAEENKTSARNLQRYIRLTYLLPELLALVDDKKIGLGTGEQLSYLKEPSQEVVYRYCYAGEKPQPLKEAQARTLREVEADPDRIIDEELLEELLAPKKKVRFRTLKIEMSKLRDYFPTGTPEEVVIQAIHTALAIYFEDKEET